MSFRALKVHLHIGDYHETVLKPDAEIPNIRPCKYSHFQKEEIEK